MRTHKDLKVSVIGLGVGYALSCALAQTGYQVVGLDLNPEIVERPRRDKSLDRLLRDSRIASVVRKNLHPTTDYRKIAGSDIVMICVSTGD